MFINMNPDKEFIADANTASLTQILFTLVQLSFVIASLAGASYATNKLADASVSKASNVNMSNERMKEAQDAIVID
jgi:hypothetical protein